MPYHLSHLLNYSYYIIFRGEMQVFCGVINIYPQRELILKGKYAIIDVYLWGMLMGSQIHITSI